ncbi:DNA polymerase IV [Saxibacter everestensis]|uniref:DNA polymerase IV n=1 Tax=Saxibacter everestensis TaxID=2909229 RepID=A0ABY8QYG4_9MICO|nr:DNA polymerase IV [Brevibacteriaceae bacterium ZFBP1038]
MSRKQLDRSGGDLSSLGADDTGCTILHLDMDAFFASVELLERPELRGRPVIVGGSSHRGVVVSATYEARAYGVHAAMPMTRARRLCPQATVIPPSKGAYSAFSAQVMELIAQRTDQIQKISIDEAFIDVGSAVRRLGSPATIAADLRADVRRHTGLVCSIGVASTLFVAKLASTRAKPDGLLVIPAQRVLDFLSPMQVQALPGVGEKTQASLARFGITTIGDLAATRQSVIQRALGAHGAHLWQLANGIDPRVVSTGGPEKSIGAEETFDIDLSARDELRRELLRLSEKVALRLRSAEFVGRVVVLKVRYSDFFTVTRSRTLDQGTDVASDIYAAVVELFDALRETSKRPLVRLLGVRVEQLSPSASAHRQLTIGEREFGRREAEQASDAARRKFGTDAIRPASLLKRSE